MSTVLRRLPQFRVLRLTGADRVSLLQGQSSNDAQRVTPGEAQLTSFNDPKGRCLAVAVLAATADAHLLVTEASVAAGLAKRLSLYILRSQVKIALADDLVVCGRLTGTDAPAWHQTQAGEALEIALPDARRLVVTTTAGSTACADDDGGWRLADVRLGLPWVVAQTVGHFVPLWLGLERFAAIDYRKGCYTGQEIVARTHYLGKQKQALYRTRAAVALAPGTTVRTGDGREAGEVVQGATAADGTQELLLVLRSALTAGPLAADGVAIGDPLPCA